MFGVLDLLFGVSGAINGGQESLLIPRLKCRCPIETRIAFLRGGRSVPRASGDDPETLADDLRVAFPDIGGEAIALEWARSYPASPVIKSVHMDRCCTRKVSGSASVAVS